MLNKPIDRKYFFSIISLIIIIILPGGLSYTLNGLPIVGKFELIFFFVIPVLFLIKYNLIFEKKLHYLILIILFLKVINVLGPNLGVKHKIYDTNVQDNYIKTYDSIWNKRASNIQKFNWKNKLNFPIDWIPNTVPKGDLNFPSYTSIDEFNDLELIFQSKFYFISNGSYLRIKDNNITNSQSINIYNIDGKRVDDEIKIFSNQGIYLTQGIYRIQLVSKIKKKNSKFEIQNTFKILNKDFYISSFLLSSVFNDEYKIQNINFLKLLQILSNIYDFLIIFLCIVIIYKLLQYILIDKFKKYLFIIVLFFLILSQIFKSILYDSSFYKYFDSLAFSSTLLVSFFILFFKIKNEDFYKYNNAKFFFGFSIILFFIYSNYNLINIIDFYGFINDDWKFFQQFAREIVLNLDIPHSDKVFRPGARYLLAIQNIIFGKSTFANILVEAWLLFFAILLTFKIIILSSNNQKLSFLGSLMILIIFLGENFILYLGKGLSSYFAYPLILLILYFFMSKNISAKNIWFLFPLVLIVVWLREEYIILLFSLIFFVPKIGFNFYNNNYFNFIKLTLSNKIIFNYILIISLCLITVFIITGISTNNFLNHPNIGFSYKDSSPFESIYRLLTGTNKLWDMPRTYSPILIIIFCISLLKFLKIIKINKINPGFFFSIISIYFTYLFLSNVNYNPRYLTSLIFISVIYLTNLIYSSDKIYFLFLNKFFSKKQ